MGRTQGHRRRGGAGRWLAAAAMTVIATASAGCGLLGDDDATPDDDIVEAVTVALEAVGTDGDDPFFDSVAISETTLPDDIATAAIDGILTAASDSGSGDDDRPAAVAGDTPGLFGGTRDQGTCDTARLGEFLTDPANAEKATAFATALGISTADIGQVLAGYTPITLTLDTLVTNHGYRDGQATPFPAVLQAGTAVLVDATGTPRVKCSCGNPLTPPATDLRLTTTTVTGTPWNGWTPTTTATVRPAPAPLTDLTLTDTTTGDTYQQPVGSTPGGGEPIDPTTVLLPANVCYADPRLTEYPVSTTHPPVQMEPAPDGGGTGAAEMTDSEGATHSVWTSAGVTADLGSDGTTETVLVVECYDHRAANVSGSFIGFVTLRPGPDGAPVAVGGTVPAASRTPELSLEGDVLVEQGLTFGPTDNHADGPTTPAGSRWRWNGDGWDPDGAAAPPPASEAPAEPAEPDAPPATAPPTAGAGGDAPVLREGSPSGSGCSPGGDTLPDGWWFGHPSTPPQPGVDFELDLACHELDPGNASGVKITDEAHTLRHIDVADGVGPLCSGAALGVDATPCAAPGGGTVWVRIEGGVATRILVHLLTS